mmetsp:Transcript_1436/g.5178  ORF Transcript_1436/g.5178 Transcript_1436/m.5178 type:complete len:234 (-) Transcript_1436:1204-1905(-)
MRIHHMRRIALGPPSGPIRPRGCHVGDACSCGLGDILQIDVSLWSLARCCSSLQRFADDAVAPEARGVAARKETRTSVRWRRWRRRHLARGALHGAVIRGAPKVVDAVRADVQHGQQPRRFNRRRLNRHGGRARLCGRRDAQRRGRESQRRLAQKAGDAQPHIGVSCGLEGLDAVPGALDEARLQRQHPRVRARGLERRFHELGIRIELGIRYLCLRGMCVLGGGLGLERGVV